MANHDRKCSNAMARALIARHGAAACGEHDCKLAYAVLAGMLYD